MVVLHFKSLKDLTKNIFEAIGCPSEDAEWVADCLVVSNLKGVDSHGVRLVPGYVKSIEEGRIKLGARTLILKETPAITIIDGCGGFGYTIARDAMKITIKKAKKVGIAYTGVRNIGHLGRVGRWVEMALDQDMIGFATQPGGRFIAPWGGVERKLPIAPIAIAIPTCNKPDFLLDTSLGPSSMGKLRLFAIRGVNVPEGWLIDEKGYPLTDPKVFVEGYGSMLPLGQNGLGYKGSALNLIEDILCGPLLSAMVTRGITLAVLNISIFTTIEEFKRNLDTIIEEVKSSKLAEGFKEILMPGELEFREEKRRRRDGIFIDDQYWTEIIKVAKSLGLETSQY